MAVLTLSQANAALVQTNYYENSTTDANSTGWCQMTSDGIIYGELRGYGVTYNSYDDPLLGTITSARSINENGNTNWTVTGIGLAASDISDVRYALQYSDAFYGDMVRVILSGNDTIIGSSGNDLIKYSTGKDVISGGAGLDTMDFSGSEYTNANDYDKLVVNLANLKYSVTTNANVVVTSTIYNVENVIGSNENDRITGNAQNNRLEGRAGDDIIYGGAGNDYIDGGYNYWSDNDQLYGESGNDLIVGSRYDTYIDGGADIDTVSYKGESRSVLINLATGIGYHGYYSSYYGTWDYEDSLISIENAIGSSWNDTIIGSSGNNTISGGAGNDTLNGGNGIDTIDFLTSGYRGVNVSLAAGLASGQGSDNLQNFENVFGSNHNDIIAGNSVANTLVGNGGVDSISGAAGNDYLFGNLGNDTLTGGVGLDTFVFDTALDSVNNVDKITDFSHLDDTIRLKKTIFSQLTPGLLLSSQLKCSLTGLATDSNDYILYNITTGALLYDKDGNGSTAAIQFATLNNHPATIDYSDFVVIA